MLYSHMIDIFQEVLLQWDRQACSIVIGQCEVCITYSKTIQYQLISKFKEYSIFLFFFLNLFNLVFIFNY